MCATFKYLLSQFVTHVLVTHRVHTSPVQTYAQFDFFFKLGAYVYVIVYIVNKPVLILNKFVVQLGKYCFDDLLGK